MTLLAARILLTHTSVPSLLAMTQPELDALFSAGTTFTALGNR